MITCPKCGAPAEASHRYCGACGAPLASHQRWLWAALIAVAAGLAAYGILSILGSEVGIRWARSPGLKSVVALLAAAAAAAAYLRWGGRSA